VNIGNDVGFNTKGNEMEQPIDYTNRNNVTPGTDVIDDARKPPIGVPDRYIVDHDRFIDLCIGISNYYNDGVPIPIKWVEEWNELCSKVRPADWSSSHGR